MGALLASEITRAVVEVTLPDGRRVWADGTYNGLPIWRWGTAPLGLLTPRQLKEQRLAPTANSLVGHLAYHRAGAGQQLADLHDVDQAREVEPMTEGRWRTIFAMLAARRVCTICGPVDHYTRFGVVGGDRLRFCKPHWRDDRAELVMVR